MTDLSSLIERLEKATSPSNDLDYQISSLVRGTTVGAGDYTSSIDAAVALAERVLPGWHWGLTQGDDGEDAGEFQASIWPGVQPFPAESEIFGDHDIAAISLVLETLRALQSKGPEA